MPFYAGQIINADRLGNVVRHSTTPSLRAFWAKYSGTTTSVGFVTVTHNAGFTPSVVVVCGASPTTVSNYAGAAVVSSITATTFQVRFMNLDSTALNTVAVEFYAFLGE